MADIRIKDLPTTATQTASDDFIALDGTVNGTRKIDASAPSFKTSVTSPSVVAPAATNLTLAGGSTGASLVLGSGTTSPYLQLRAAGRFAVNAIASNDSYIEYVGNAGTAGTTSVVVGQSAGGLGIVYNRSNAALTFGTNSLERGRFTDTGNLLIGTTTDTSSRLKLVGTDNSGPKTWTASSAALSGALFDSYQDSGGNGFQRYTDIVSLQDSDGVNGGGVIRFVTNSISSDSGTEAMRVTKLQNLLIGGTTDITGSGGLKVFGTTAASSTTSGALQVAGGVGVAGAIYGDELRVKKGGGTSSFINGLTLESGSAAGNFWPGIDWRDSTMGSVARIYTFREGGSFATSMVFQTSIAGSATPTTALTINSAQAATFAGVVTIKPATNVTQLLLEQNNATANWGLFADSTDGSLQFKRSAGSAALSINGGTNGTTFNANPTVTTGGYTTLSVASTSSVAHAAINFLTQSDGASGWTFGKRDDGLSGIPLGSLSGIYNSTGVFWLTKTGGLVLKDSSASSSSTTGALQVAGGIYAGAASVFAGDVTRSGTGESLFIATTSNTASSGRVRLTNSGAGGRTFDILSGGSTAADAAIQSKFSIYDITAGASRFTIDSAGAATFANTVTATGLTLNLSSGFGSTILAGITGYNNFTLNGSNSLTTGMGMYGGASGDAALYINAPATGNVYFRIGGSDKVAIKPSGNLLVGGNTDISGTGGMKIFGTTAGSAGVGALVVSGGLATGAASYFGGNVTIGAKTGAQAGAIDSLTMSSGYPSTATPTNQQLKIYLGYVSATEAYGFTTDNVARIWYHAGNTTGPTGGHIFATGGTERVAINSAGTTFSSLIFPQQAITASAPTYVKGAIYFDTTLNKLRVGGATGWETITSV